MVNKGPFMEYLRGHLSHDGGTTVDTLRILTPSSKTEKLAMLIHQITLIVQQPAFNAGSWQFCDAVITDESHEGDDIVPWMEDSSVLHRVRQWAQEGIIAGTWTRWREGEETIEFDPPVLYPKAAIYLEMEVSDPQAAGKYSSCMIGYTLEKVSDEAFIAALVE